MGVVDDDVVDVSFLLVAAASEFAIFVALVAALPPDALVGVEEVAVDVACACS